MKKAAFFSLVVLGLLLLSSACTKSIVTPSLPLSTPTATATVTDTPTLIPTAIPTDTPVVLPTATPDGGPIFIPNATPTKNPTAVCGFTLLPPASTGTSLSNMGVTVIRSVAEWNAYTDYSNPLIVSIDSPTPTPIPVAPPVDFSTQMVVAAALPCPCWAGNYTIDDVCVEPDAVRIYVTNYSCPSCMVCMAINSYSCIKQMVAVPQSDLPVSFVYNWIIQ
jgi:hypothetical protein